jgi:hypothetical protein
LPYGDLNVFEKIKQQSHLRVALSRIV